MAFDPPKVVLSRSEMMSAGNVGLIRRIVSLGKLNDKMHSPDANPWQIDIEGSMAEMAYAKVMGMFWSGSVGTFKAPDVGNVQIRSTPSLGNSLIIRAGDDNEDVFVLVIGSAPNYIISGYIRGGDGKKPEWIRSPNGGMPAYFVPQSALRPVSELKCSGVC